MKFPPVRYTLPSSGVAILYSCTMATRAELLTVAGLPTAAGVDDAIENDRRTVEAIAGAIVQVGDDVLPELPAQRAEWIAATFPLSAVKEAFVAILSGAVDEAFLGKSSQPSG